MSGRHSDEVARDANVPITRAPPRRSESFVQAEVPQRPNYLPEEAEAAGGRSEIWATLKGLVLAVLAILVLGWLLTSI